MQITRTFGHNIDESTERLVKQIRGIRVIDNSVAVISNLADYGLIWALIGVTRATTSRRLRRKSLSAVLFTAIAAPLVNWSLKFIVWRPRPYQSSQAGYSPTWSNKSMKREHLNEGQQANGDQRSNNDPQIQDMLCRTYSQVNAYDDYMQDIYKPFWKTILHTPATHLSRLASFETRTPQSPSFPSGHSLTAWCAATMLAADDPLGPVYYLLAAAISYSRLHLGHHYATDVIGGTVLGVALGNAGRQWISNADHSQIDNNR